MGITQDRQALHRMPELDFSLPDTLRYLKNALQPLGCRLFSPAKSSLCAWFDFGAPSALAFRADMDALPISERTGLPFASQNPGQMHACGHDGHMAILLELARRLAAEPCKGRNILLIFQPAEETTGGARQICQSGVLQEYKVEALFGLHLWPGLERGSVASRKGAMLCRSCGMTLEVTGRSAHIARPEEGLDALDACMRFYCQARQLGSSLPASVERVLNFGRMEAGTVSNAVAAGAHLGGSLRVFDEELFQQLRVRLRAIAADISGKTGCTLDLRFTDGYPAVVNPPELVDRVCGLVPVRLLEKPSMTAEDFSFYQQQVPAMFFFLGVGDTAPLHADTFDFDEGVLPRGADLFETLARKF